MEIVCKKQVDTVKNYMRGRDNASFETYRKSERGKVDFAPSTNRILQGHD